MGAESWAKRASGLLVGEVRPPAPHPHPHPCPNCCENQPSELCDCLCDHCHDGTAACCYQIDMDAFAATDPEDCTECLGLNRNYRLSEVDAVGSTCVWKYYLVDDECEGEDVCGITVATLELAKDGSNDYVWTFTLGDNVWELNVGTDKPQCCKPPYSNGTAVMTNTATMAECDMDDVTSPVILESVAGYECGNPENNDCTPLIAGTQPCCMQIDIEGVEYDSPPGDADTCWHCTCYDGSWLATASTTAGICGWQGPGSVDYPEFCAAWLIWVTVTAVGDNYQVKVEVGYSRGHGNNAVFVKTYTEKPEAASFSGEAIPYMSGDGDECDWNNATIKLTARLAIDPDICKEDIPYGECSQCLCSPSSLPDIKLTVSDVEAGDCDDCVDTSPDGPNGVFILSWHSGCRWQYQGETNVCSWPMFWILTIDSEVNKKVGARLYFDEVGGVDIHWSGYLTSEYRALNCSNFDPVELTYNSAGLGLSRCSFEPSTVTIESV